jgi:hypothetical protein
VQTLFAAEERRDKQVADTEEGKGEKVKVEKEGS